MTGLLNGNTAKYGQLIQQVGFPIVAFIMMFGLCVWIMMTLNESVQELTQATRDQTVEIRKSNDTVIPAINNLKNELADR